ncbi:MAG TPA: hypothetical protein VF412_15070 [Bdellovibrio sp.]|uniref:hypothetical protein n=1 Tax=Bdellovibrio sp. TaxID=28201 RepID=UPI002EFD9940
MKAKFFITALITLVSSFAFADKMGPNGDKFYEEAAHFVNACSEEPCKAPYSALVLYSQKAKLNNLEAQVRTDLKDIAVEQAQVWGDTILEGDYVAAGHTRLDLVTGYYKNNVLVGYKIQYSEKAWFTGNCHYTGTRESLKDCKEGRIQETSYVSEDRGTYFTDEGRQADFAPGEGLVE